MFKTKLRKIGNSIGVLIPRKQISKFKVGDIINIEIITDGRIRLFNPVNPIIVNTDDSGIDIHLDKTKIFS